MENFRCRIQDIFPHQEETNRQQFYDEMMKTAVCLPSYRFYAIAFTLLFCELPD